MAHRVETYAELVSREFMDTIVELHDDHPTSTLVRKIRGHYMITVVTLNHFRPFTFTVIDYTKHLETYPNKDCVADIIANDVWHTTLVNELRKCRLPTPLCRMIDDYVGVPHSATRFTPLYWGRCLNVCHIPFQDLLPLHKNDAWELIYNRATGYLRTEARMFVLRYGREHVSNRDLKIIVELWCTELALDELARARELLGVDTLPLTRVAMQYVCNSAPLAGMVLGWKLTLDDARGLAEAACWAGNVSLLRGLHACGHIDATTIQERAVFASATSRKNACLRELRRWGVPQEIVLRAIRAQALP